MMIEPRSFSVLGLLATALILEGCATAQLAIGLCANTLTANKAMTEINEQS